MYSGRLGHGGRCSGRRGPIEGKVFMEMGITGCVYSKNEDAPESMIA
jgi:hypothetical protein